MWVEERGKKIEKRMESRSRQEKKGKSKQNKRGKVLKVWVHRHSFQLDQPASGHR